EVLPALIALSHIGGAGAQAVIEEVALDASRPLALREAAIPAFATLPATRGNAAQGTVSTGDWRLLQLVEADRVPASLRDAAAAVLFASPRAGVRNAAAQHLTPPANRTADGALLPLVEALVEQRGDAER